MCVGVNVHLHKLCQVAALPVSSQPLIVRMCMDNICFFTTLVILHLLQILCVAVDNRAQIQWITRTATQANRIGVCGKAITIKASKLQKSSFSHLLPNLKLHQKHPVVWNKLRPLGQNKLCVGYYS